MALGNVLVASDDPAIRGLLCQALALEGYEAVALRRVGAVLRFARAWQPHLIVFDVVRRGAVEGWDAAVVRACWRLRTDPATAHLPILLLASDLGQLEAAPLLPVRAYLAKPFDLSELYRLAATHIAPSRGSGLPWGGALLDTPPVARVGLPRPLSFAPVPPPVVRPLSLWAGRGGPRE